MTTNAPLRPGGLTALCILAIVLGALGVLMAVVTVAGTFLQDPMQRALSKWQENGDEEATRAQQQLNDETRAFAEAHKVRNIVFSILKLLVAGGLLTGGILTLRLRPHGRKILLIALASAIVFEIAQIWPAVEAIPFTQRAMELSMEVQQKQVQGKGQNADDAAAMMRVMAKAITAMQLMVIAGMFLAKTGFYAFGLWYLTRPHVAALFVRTAVADFSLPDAEWR
ncbi:MAG TPA: hypothetical protein VFI31_28405 [Pirellulales bacterium]|nr:hypothetical protein [Pirellulales bacterium]